MRISKTPFLFLIGGTTTSAFAPSSLSSTVLSSSRGRSSTTPPPKTTLQLQVSDVTDTFKTAFATVDNGLKNIVNNLDVFNLSINEKTKGLLQDLLSKIQTIMGEGSMIKEIFLKYATSLSQNVDQWLTTQNPQVESFFRHIADQVASTHININTPETIGITTFLTYFVVSSLLTWDEAPPPSKPYPLQRYDPVAAQAYFDGRVIEFTSRALEIAVKSLNFGLKVLQDFVR